MNADTDQMDEVTLNLYNHLCSLLCQRDFYIRVTILAISFTLAFFVICSFRDVHLIFTGVSCCCVKFAEMTKTSCF